MAEVEHQKALVTDSYRYGQSLLPVLARVPRMHAARTPWPNLFKTTRQPLSFMGQHTTSLLTVASNYSQE